MRLSCRFVLANQLKPEHLHYLVLPEKVPHHIRGYKKASELHALLPVFLQRPLAPYIKKDVATYLERLKRELKKGQLVALSTSPHSSPISVAQLSSEPGLAKKVAELQGAPVSYRKASYKPITDNTVLARNITYVPVEPMPESKIVVEFAGQWPNNAACLMLSKSAEQDSKISNARSDIQYQHRSLATFKGLDEEARDLYIKVPCSNQPQPIILPVGKMLSPVDKEVVKEEWDNVLIPILPMLERGKEYVLSSAGYFYVVWDNKVWREVEVAPNGFFADVDLDYHRGAEPQTTKAFRHVNIDGANLVPDYYIGEEPFELYQAGRKVFSGVLKSDQSARVFRLTEEEVDVAFPSLDIDPVTVKTVKSPSKAGGGDERVAQGIPLPHIWVPYKVNGAIQSECYLYYSPVQLTLSELSNLESDPGSMATSLSELKVYSESQSFDNAGTVIIPIAEAGENQFGAALINSFTQSNIAGFKMTPCSHLPTIRYLHEPLTDQPDDFFALRNVEHDWMSKSFFRSTKTDDQGYMTHRFAFPPQEVKTVDIIRAVHSNYSTGLQRLVVMKENVPIAELLD